MKKHGLWQYHLMLNEIERKYGERPPFIDGEYKVKGWQALNVTNDGVVLNEPFKACDAITMCAIRYMRLKRIPLVSRHFLALVEIIEARTKAHHMTVKATRRRLGWKPRNSMALVADGSIVYPRFCQFTVERRAENIAKIRANRRLSAWRNIYEVQSELRLINTAIKKAQTTLKRKESA